MISGDSMRQRLPASVAENSAEAPSLLSLYCRAMAAIARAISVASAVLMAWLIAITGYQVFGRYVLNDSPTWVERAALLTIVYVALPMAAVGIRQRFHMSVTILVQYLNARWSRIIDLLCDLALGFFGIAMAWYGGVIAERVWASKMSVLPLPEGVTYLPLVFSGILILLFSLEHLALTLRELAQPEKAG